MVTSPQELVAAKARAREIEGLVDDPITAAIAYELLLALVQEQVAGHDQGSSRLPAKVDGLRSYKDGERVWLDVDYLPHPGWSGPGAETVAVQRNDSDVLPLSTLRTGSGMRTVSLDPTLPGEVVVSFRGPKGVEGQAAQFANHAFTLGRTLEQTASDALVEKIEDQVDASRTGGFLTDWLRYQIHTLSAQVLEMATPPDTNKTSLLLALNGNERHSLQQYLILLHEMLSDIIQVKPIAELTDELHLLAELTTAVKTVTQSIEKQ